MKYYVMVLRVLGCLTIVIGSENNNNFVDLVTKKQKYLKCKAVVTLPKLSDPRLGGSRDTWV